MRRKTSEARALIHDQEYDGGNSFLTWNVLNPLHWDVLLPAHTCRVPGTMNIGD